MLKRGTLSLVPRVSHARVRLFPLGNFRFKILQAFLECVLDGLSSHIPDVLATWSSLPLYCFGPIVVLYSFDSVLLFPIPRSHAHPEISPMVLAGSELAVSIDVYELTTKALTEHGVVEG